MSRESEHEAVDAVTEATADGRVPAEVEALLAAVRRPGEADAQILDATLAAFREARDTGAHVPPGRWWRVRRRDDWRPARRRGALPVRAAFASLAATVTLGGVALAAQSGAIPAPFGIGDGGSGGGGAGARPGTSAPATPGVARGSAEGATEGPTSRSPSAAVTPSGPARTAQAREDEARCVAYLAAEGRGGGAGPGTGAGRGTDTGTAFERLEAGAADAGVTVQTYCEGLLGAATKVPAKPSQSASKGTKPPEAGTGEDSKPGGKGGSGAGSQGGSRGQ
ncbi:hypothetical protein J7I98_15385 [Streptomyces sp. ISL-98]|uniref:hypothetical protein n=1 Tax=Streptomyces sp. ISL-98 TaxID=2819192 RepID=UPI001BE530D3|nr:hypothetical protein [Streptomyces sp. ISL-98]MBT2507250.1 hypothetical protein [Streptomyces sp. ISL-98]